jgi:signal transduction histidine kinase
LRPIAPIRTQRTFDPGELTEQVLMSLRPGLKNRNLTLAVGCEPDLRMTSYPGPYGQVLTNLFLNAVMQAFPNGQDGSIDIKVRSSGQDDIEVLFADDGCGMSHDVRRQAFNPFFTTRRDQGCVGLGLHIVHNIVTNRLGGRVHLDSAPGEGTRVQLILPRVAPADRGG